MFRFRTITAWTVLFLLACPSAYAGQSVITEAEGYSCMGTDKSRKQTEQEAMADAKRNAVEGVKTHVKSQTTVQNFQVEKDLIDAYAQATVRILREAEKGWYRDPSAGDCFKVRIQAEVVPEEGAMAKIAGGKEAMTDPSAPLNVRVWTERRDYKKGEKIKIYIQGNKPFYARVLYRDAGGNLLQLLPNVHRRENYFNGGVVYALPAGDDRFELEVSPPFGEENILVYAGTAPLGDLALQEAGGVYQVRTRGADIGIRTRGLKIAEKPAGQSSAAAEFVEVSERLTTRGR